MLNPAEIDLKALPWTPLDATAAFPRSPGIYFAIDAHDNIQYIGKAGDVQGRWKRHHRYSELERIGGVRITYLFVSNSKLLNEIEAILIAWFRPPLNAVVPKQSCLSSKDSATGLKIRVVREYPADDLPDWLRNAVEQSGKSVSEVCRQAKISTQYYYDVLKDSKSITLDTLERIEAAIGRKYPADWRGE